LFTEWKEGVLALLCSSLKGETSDGELSFILSCNLLHVLYQSSNHNLTSSG
jgi:hypothetical protein